MSRANQTAVNMGANIAGLFTPLLVNFITTPILLRILGAEGYGLQNLALVISGYLAIMDLGLDIPITKLLAEDHATGNRCAANQLLNTTLLLYLLIGLCGSVVIVLGIDFLVNTVFKIPDSQNQNARIVFQLAGIGFALTIFGSWGRACLHGMQRYGISNAIGIYGAVAASIVGVIVVYIGYGLVGFVLVRVIIYGMSSIGYIYSALRVIPYFRFDFRIEVDTLRRIRGYVGMGILIRAFGFITSGLDRALIGMWIGVSAVTIYSMQWFVITPSNGLLNSIFAFFFPMASELHSTGKFEELKNIFNKSSKFSGALTLLIFTLLLLYGDVFLRLWVGASIVDEAKGLLPLLIISSMIGQLTVPLTPTVAIGMGKIRAMSVYSVGKATVLAIGLLVFIRSFDLIGSGYAFLLSNLADIAFFIFVLRNYLKLPFYDLFRYAYMYSFGLAIPMYIIGLLIKPYINSWFSFLIVVGFLSIAYIAGGCIVGVFGETEKKVCSHFGTILLKPFKM